MKQPPPPVIDESLVALAERHEDGWRAIMVRRGAMPTVTEARTFEPNGGAAIAAWLDSSRCGDLRVVLPATSTIIRMVNLPPAPAAQSMAAMRLQAEGMFLGALPSCRVGLAVVDSEGATEHQGAIMAWPESAPGVELDARLEKIARFVPQPAAMLALVADDAPALVTDRREGSISIAMRAGGKFHLRATREPADAGDAAAWNDGLRRATAETMLNAGVAPAAVSAAVAEALSRATGRGDREAMLSPDVRARLSERVDDSAIDAAGGEWAAHWSTLLGAAVVVTGPLAELAGIRRSEASESPSRLERFVQTYSNPARALRVAVVAFAIIGVAPIATAWLRGKILEWKMPESADKFQLAQRRIDHRMSLYRELSTRTVPVSKILGDLACCTPEGVEIESIQVSPSQGVSVRGKAKTQGDKPAAAILTQMVSQMDASGVFEKTRCRWDAPDSLGFLKFDLEAPIVGPTRMPEFSEERDWAVKSLAERKYGASASGDDAAAASSASAAAPTPPVSAPAAAEVQGPDATAIASANGEQAPAERSRPSRGNSTARGSTDGEVATPAGSTPSRGIGRRAASGDEEQGGTPATAPSGVGAGGGPAAAAQANLAVPEPVSDEQLKAMSREEAQDLLNRLSKAKKRADLDEATKKRVDADWRRVLDYLIAKAKS